MSLLFFFFNSLRSPKAPDDQADMGSHEFSYAVFPHSGKQTTLNCLFVYLFVFFDQLKWQIGWVWSSGWTWTVVDSDWSFDNLCSSHLQSQSELIVSRQLMVFQTTLTQTIILNPLMKWLLGSNFSQFEVVKLISRPGKIEKLTYGALALRQKDLRDRGCVCSTVSSGEASLVVNKIK